MQRSSQQVSPSARKATIAPDEKHERQVRRVIKELEHEMRRLVDLLVNPSKN